MKIGILSDLHVEFATYTDEFPDCDYLVLAGDIWTQHKDKQAVKAKRLLKKRLKDFGKDKIIKIYGNHEGYGGTAVDLDNGTFTFIKEDGAVRFITSTGFPNPTMYAWMAMNDRFINGFSWDLIRDWSKMNWEWIERGLREPFDGKTIVVTHYLPSPKSIAEEFKRSTTNSAFMIDKEDLILKYQPDLWIHGHTHSSCDYVIDKTRVVCNPRGYHRNGVNENRNFDPSLTIDI